MTYSRELRVGADVERLDLAHHESHPHMGRCPCCGAVVVAALDTKHVTHLFNEDGWRHKCKAEVR